MIKRTFIHSRWASLAICACGAACSSNETNATSGSAGLVPAVGSQTAGNGDTGALDTGALDTSTPDNSEAGTSNAGLSGNNDALANPTSQGGAGMTSATGGTNGARLNDGQAIGGSGALATGAGGSSPSGGASALDTGGAQNVGGAINAGGMPNVGGLTNTGSGFNAGGVDVGGMLSGAGAPGIAAAGSGGAASTEAADLLAAEVLNRYRIEKPCVDSFQPSPNPDGACCCEEQAENENQHNTERFGGDAAVTYNVTLRIRGLAERYWYAGGAVDETNDLFYTGGLPTIHSDQAPNANLQPGVGACKIRPPETDGQYALPFEVPVELNPSDGCFNGFNIFALVVSEPKQTYYLNHTTDFDGADRQPHKVYSTDYTITIPIQGQAQLDFYTIDGDHHQVANDGTMIVDGAELAQPYIGNFFEFEVLGVGR